MKFEGLTSKEALKNKNLGLSNTTIDSYVPSYPTIVLKHIFSLINIVLTPLLIFLGIFQLYREIFTMSVFMVINTITSIADEIRAKKEIEKLKQKFQITANVIRDGVEKKIPVSEVVFGDLIVARESEGIVADGHIIHSEYLSLDESNITGESNYIKKEKTNKIISGSFVVSGICYYKVDAVGEDNFSNRVIKESTKFKKVKSPLQLTGEKMITTLIIFAVIFALLNLAFTYFDKNISGGDKMLSITTIVSLIIPQTLIFLFTLSFTISISKLAKKGVLVQKGASVEFLTHIDTICMDKTGTITTNRMLFSDSTPINFDEKLFFTELNAISDNLFGITKTLKVLIDKAYSKNKVKLKDTFQIPFTSTNKYSLFSGIDTKNNQSFTYVIGAFEKLSHLIPKKDLKFVQDEINSYEQKGDRVMIVLHYPKVYKDMPTKASQSIMIYAIEEELNYGILKTIKGFNDLGIKLKIISGDSYGSVKSIATKVGLTDSKILDLSKYDNVISKELLEYDIFTRANPDDKLELIELLKSEGHKVAMVGDGINDVLGLKAANVSISMESGAEVSRNISDIVLLKNDYSKLPMIFFEGENIILNLKLSTKLFLLKTVLSICMSIYYSFKLSIVPLIPSSCLIFSFLSSSLPSYVIVFSRTKPKRDKNGSFIRDVLGSAIPAGIITTIAVIFATKFFYSIGYSRIEVNTANVLLILVISLYYALILLWDSNKLRNVIVAACLFIITFLIGLLETYLPYKFFETNFYGIVILSCCAIGVILLNILIHTVLKKQPTYIKVLATILSFLWVPVVLIFPFRNYYSVARLPKESLLYIFAFGTIGGIAILISHLFKKLFGNKIVIKERSTVE